MTSNYEPRTQVRAATAADQHEIEVLIGEMIPDCDPAARWRWVYEANPGGRALTWLATTQAGEVVGCTSFFPYRMWIDGELVRAALGGDGYVRPDYRRRGIGQLMHAASREDMAVHGIHCMYGAPGAMNVSPLKHAGSRELGYVSRWSRPLTGRALGLRPRPLARAFDHTLGAALGRRGPAALDPVVRHDPRVDRVWEQARHTLHIAAVRDAAFYTWRFLDLPGRRATPYAIVERGRPIGVCALEPMHGGRVVRIVDLIAVPGAWTRSLIAIAGCCATELRADVVDIKLATADGRRRAMWRAGFFEREHKPFLCMIPPRGDRRFLDVQRWFYTCADSDLEDHS